VTARSCHVPGDSTVSTATSDSPVIGCPLRGSVRRKARSTGWPTGTSGGTASGAIASFGRRFASAEGSAATSTGMQWTTRGESRNRASS
jgi:hypothetical protein